MAVDKSVVVTVAVAVAVAAADVVEQNAELAQRPCFAAISF